MYTPPISNASHRLFTLANSLLRPSSQGWHPIELTDPLGIVFCRSYVHRWSHRGLPWSYPIASPSLANIFTSWCFSVALILSDKSSSPFLVQWNIQGSRALLTLEPQLSALCLAYRKYTSHSRWEECATFPVICSHQAVNVTKHYPASGLLYATWASAISS